MIILMIKFIKIILINNLNYYNNYLEKFIKNKKILNQNKNKISRIY